MHIKICLFISLNLVATVTSSNSTAKSDCVITPNRCPNENITFWLYTKDTQKNPHELNVGEPETLASAKFVANVQTIVLIHGYTGDRDYAPNAEIRPAFFEHGDYNIISPDYNPLAREPCYPTAVLNVPVIGRCLAQLLDELIQRNSIRLEDINVIGFSLGAHVAGAIANYLQAGEFERITGLDPALPLFVTSDNSKKLDKTDAKFVDVIHTNALERGKLEPSGHTDFYVNGGVTQPGCETGQNNMSMSSCSHWRAVAYYAESINSPVGFYGKKCLSWIVYMLGICDIRENIEEEIMGEYTPSTARGLWFVDTNPTPPYARGKSSTQYRDKDKKEIMSDG